MKRIIAAVTFGLIASSAFAQTFDRSPTDPFMPAHSYDPTARPDTREARRQVASAGTTRSDAEISYEARERNEDYTARHVERQEGYFDPSN